MGFLSGAYGKLMAGKLVRDIQFQMTSVQSRLRRVTREIGQKEKMYQAQERNMKQAMQAQMQYALQGAAGMMMGQSAGNMDINAVMGMWGGMSQQQMSAYSAISQQIQMQFMQSQTMWQNMFEMQREADLQALKDLEEDLQVEKDNLESRLKIAQGEYEAKKEEEKQGAQNLKPDYTGQG